MSWGSSISSALIIFLSFSASCILNTIFCPSSNSLVFLLSTPLRPYPRPASSSSSILVYTTFLSGMLMYPVVFSKFMEPIFVYGAYKTRSLSFKFLPFEELFFTSPFFSASCSAYFYLTVFLSSIGHGSSTFYIL